MEHDVAAHIRDKCRLWWEHMARLRTVSAEEKFRAAAMARIRSRELLRAGVRLRHPKWPAARIDDEVGYLIYGPGVWEKFRERDRRRADVPRG